MKLAEAELESVSPYSQGRHYKVDKLPKELDSAYEERTWRERCHVDEAGIIFIPPMAFANSIKEAAKFLGTPIPGKARQTFTKHFEAGVLVQKPLSLEIKKTDVKPEWLFLPSDGQRGGGRRVDKCFPLIPSWKGTVEFVIVDDLITEDVFLETLTTAGSLIGIGRFRPRNLGYYGRFLVKKLTWAA